MNLSQIWKSKFIPPFLLCLVGHLLLPLLFPYMRFMAFAPCITLIISWVSLPYALWCSAFIGLLLDLYASRSPLGFFGLIYALTTLIVYRFRKYFLEEKLYIFAVFSVLYSFVGTVIHFFIYAPVRVHMLTICTDILLMPILDGVYALSWVLFPLAAYKFIKKQYTRWQIEQS